MRQYKCGDRVGKTCSFIPIISGVHTWCNSFENTSSSRERIEEELLDLSEASTAQSLVK